MVLIIDSAQKRFFSTEEIAWPFVSAPRKKLLNTLTTYIHLDLEILKKINQIILINLVGSSVSKEKLRRFLNYINISKEVIRENAEYEILFENIFSKIIIFNREDLKIKKNNDIQDENFYFYDVRTISLEPLINVIKEDKIIFVSAELSPLLATVIQQFESVEGYYIPHWKRIDKNKCPVKIKNPKEYLRFYLDMYKRSETGLIDYNSVPQYWSELFKNEEVYGNYPQPISIYKNISRFIYGDIDKIVLSGGDEILSDKLITEIKVKREFLEQAKNDIIDRTVKETTKKILIKNITGMDITELDKFLKQIESKSYEKTSLIMRNISKRISYQARKNNYTALPTTKRLRPIFPVIFYMLSKETGLISNFDNITSCNILLRFLSSEALKEYFNSIDCLNNMEIQINEFKEKSISIGHLTCPDFWYDFLKDIEKLHVLETVIAIPNLKSKGVIDYSTDSNQFLRRENNKIKIIFDGKDIALRSEDLLGLQYLRLIIKYGIKGMTYQEIENNHRDSITEGKEKPIFETTIMMDDDEEDNTTTLRPIEKFDGYQLIDKTTIDTIKKKIERLEEKKEILESELNFEEVKSIEVELTKLYKYLNTSLNIKGESRITNTELEKSKRRVKKAINIAFKQIKVENLKLYSYLVKSVILDKGKDKFFYIPDPKIDWVLEL